MVYCVGLTGGIGCGKSTVAQAFAKLGAGIIDTDAISHALTRKNAAGFQAIIQAFGPEFVQANGELDRAKLRNLVFADTSAKQKLEAILHPLIHAQVLSEIQACITPYVLIVVPLLFETRNYLPLLDRKLVVDCPEATQIERTMARSQLSEAEVRVIMANQLSRNERLRLADDVLPNNEDMSALAQRVTELDQRYRLAAQAAAKA